MPTYAGISFYVARKGDTTRYWERESHVSRRHIPYGNRDDVQYGGKGHWRWTGQIYVESEAAYAALEAASGTTTGRTLTDFLGETKSDVRLNSVTAPDRLVKAGAIYCDVEFEYGV